MTGWPRLSAALSAAVLACAATAATAQANASDVAATRAYFRAQQAEARSEVDAIPAGARALARFESGFNGECAGVLTGAPKGAPSLTQPLSPQIEGRLDLEADTAGVLLVVDVRPVAPAWIRFTHVARRLHWSNRKLTRLAHALAAQHAKEATEVRRPLPDLCADMKAWVAGGYRAPPPAIELLSFTNVPTLDALEKELLKHGEEDPEEAVARLLRPYERGDERKTMRRIHRLSQDFESALTDAEKVAVSRLELESPS